MENQQLNIFSPENSTNQILGQQIRQEIETLAKQFIELDDEEKKLKRTKKSLILEIADKFERLHDLGEYPLPIHYICSSIYYYLSSKGFSINDRYIRDVCKDNAPQYLNPSYQDRIQPSIDIKLEQEEIINALKTLKHANLDILTREQKQELVPELFEISYTVEDYCRKQNITPAPGSQAQEAHYDAEELDPFRDTISTDKPDFRTSPTPLAEATIILGEAIVDCGQTIINTGKMMRMYPPEESDQELEKNAVTRVVEWATFWDYLEQGMANGTDRKYRRSVIQWLKIAEDEKDYGKHASSSKNTYTARFKDPKTGAWKEEIRKLTRESIGDTVPRVREFARLFKKSVPACFDFIQWSEKYMFPYCAGLSVKLSSKLSDRSLR